MILRKLTKYTILMTTIAFINAVQADESPVVPTEMANRACIDKDKGDLCDFVNKNGSPVNGTCKPDPNGKLSCVSN